AAERNGKRKAAVRQRQARAAPARQRADVCEAADQGDASGGRTERQDAVLVLEQNDALPCRLEGRCVVRGAVDGGRLSPAVDADGEYGAQDPAHHVGKTFFRKLALLEGLAQRTDEPFFSIDLHARMLIAL